MSNCKKGEIRRKGYWVKGYTRSDGVRVKRHWVPATCVKDTGRPGKTPKSQRVLPKLKPDGLGKYGYTTKKKADVRRRALAEGVSDVGYLKILRRLVAISNYNKRTTPTVHKKMRYDIGWLKKNYGAK